MILKARVHSFHAVHDPTERWVYIDRICEVQTYGYAIVDPADNRISCTRAELRKYVEEGWGVERSFDTELWPEFRDDSEQWTVSVVRLTREGGRMILALLTDTAFLMSDDGKTIDRLH